MVGAAKKRVHVVTRTEKYYDGDLESDMRKLKDHLEAKGVAKDDLPELVTKMVPKVKAKAKAKSKA